MNCEFISWEFHATLLILTVVGLVWFSSSSYFQFCVIKNLAKNLNFDKKIGRNWPIIVEFTL
jgi:hypothetical protein